MKRILSARGRVAVSVLVTALLASLSAFYYFNAVPVRSWHMPEVSIVTPADGEDVAGPVVISATYSVSNGHVHTMRTLIDGQVADSKPAGSQSGTYTFTWNSASVTDGPHSIEVRAYTAAPPSDHFNKETITIHVSNALCRLDADCDDQDDHTKDTCANAGTPNAVCAHAPIACLNDAECNDSEPLTLDSCQNAGTSNSLCVNTAIQCNNHADCNDSDTHTQDICLNAGTVSANCQHNSIACLNDAECNDSNPLSLDSCQNPGMASSACVNQPIACGTNADCNDSDPLTLDECENPGTTASSCSNTAIVCNTNSDCDDSESLTQDVCVNGGTNASSCAHDPLACNSSADCDDGNTYTLDQCENPGTTSSVCTHAAIACLTNQDCNDSNALTLDSCQNPGASNASCVNTPIACNTNADCEDSDAQTTDQCTNGGTVNATCSHVPTDTEPDPEPEDLNLDIISPDDGLVSNQTAITVTGVAIPGAALTINGNSVSINGAGAFSSAMTLSEGANTITIKCCLGGECLTETRAVTVDTQSPEILDATVEDGILYIGVRDNAGGTGLDASYFEVTIDGGAVSATYDATRKSLRIIPGDLTPGAHIVTASVSDLAGNTAQRTVNVVFRPNAGLKIIFKKLPGRQVPDESTESSAFIAPPLDQTAATGLISGETDSIMSQILEPEPVISSASPSSAWDFSTLDAPGDYTVEARKFLDLLDGKIDRAPGAKLPPGLLKKLDCSKAPDGNPLTFEAAASYSGDIETQVTVEQGIQVDEQSIEVKVDGAPVPYQYDESTQSITATADELTRGVHTVEVSAADTDGNTTIATTAFGVDPNVLQFTLGNMDNPGGTITVGQRFKVTLELDGDPGGTPWFMLFNANYMSDPAPHLIGWIYEMNTVSQAPGSYLYDYTGWFYTSFDQNEEEASVIGAAIPLDAGATQFTTAAGTIQVENGYARPNINFIELSKYNSPDKSLQVGDSYLVQASGSQGIQQMFSVLLNIDTFIQASNPLDAAVLKNGYVPGDPMTLVDPMVEDPAYGSGHYIVANNAVPLESALDVQGSPVRAIMPMVCSPTSGNVCGVGNVMYLGSAPVMNSVTLMNLSGSDPNAPFTNTARGFRVEVQGGIAPEHLANMYLVLANAAKVTAGVPLKKTPGQPLLDWTITNGFAEVSGQSGVYAAEGVIDGYIDDDGTLASEVVAIVSAAGFYEDAKSAPHAIEQQPPVPAPDPSTIETIAGQTVGADSHVTSDLDTPVITGSAPENSLVTIYELDPAGSIGAMTVPQGSLAPQAIYSSGQAFADTFNDTALSQTLWRFTDSIEARTQVVNSVVELEPRNTPAWLETTNPLLITGDFSLQFDFQFPDDDPQSSMTLHFGTMARYDTPDMFQIYWQGNGEIEMRNTDNVQNRTPYTPPTPGTPHTIQLDYSNSSQTLTLSIDGSIAAVSDPIFSLENSAVSLFFSYQQDSGTNRTAFLDNVNTTMAMPPGYRIAAPALSIDNGPVYDAFGNGAGGFFTNDGQVIFTDGSSMIAGIDGTKDIYAALVTLYDLLYDPQQPPLPQAALTLYTAGNPNAANGDQSNAVHAFLEAIKSQGGITGYTVDAVGAALSAQPGGGFAPSPMSAQSMVCSYEPGTPPSLTWDSAQNSYIGSHSALEYQGRAYDAFVAWGQSQTSDAPNIIGPEGGPVWWADGSADISVGALCSPSQGWCATGYGIQELIDQLQGNVDPELHALAHGVLRAPAAPGEDYTLDQGALESAGLTPAKRLTCAGYGRTPIAIATADNSGAYQATKDAPFAATGDHLLYAESADPATGRPISNSSIVTYTLEAGQGNPPVLVSIDNQPVANTPEGSDYTPRVCALSPDGAPVDFYVQKSGIPVLSGNAAIPDVNGNYCADLDSLLTNNDINSEGDFIITASTAGGSSQPGTYRLRTILPGEACASVWPMFRCNYSNTAANSESFTESLIEAWTAPFQTGDDILSSPAVTGDKIFIGSKDKYIYAIDRETGTELWKHFTANYTYPSPAVSDGVVYTGSYSAYVFALNEETGAEYWKTQIVGGIFASPIVKDHVLYVGTTGGKIYAFDVTNVKQGIVTQKWAAPYDTPNTAGTFSTPALRDGVLYVGTTGGPVVALDAETGQELWSANTANNAWSSPAVAYGKVFAGSWGSKVYAFDKYSGQEIWTFDTDGWIYSSPAVAYGKVYIGSNDGNVYALNEQDGALAWPQPFLTGGAVQSSPVVSNGRVVVGSADGNLYILDAHSGQLLHSISVGDQVYSSPSIVDGFLYFGSYDNKLYAFKPGQDQDPPVISNLTVDPTAISPAVGGTARITADVTDAGSFGWTLLVREQNSSNEIQIAYGADSNIDVTWDGKVNGNPVQDGIYTVIIRAQDFTPNANQSEIIANNALTVDSAAPVTAILSPAANAFIGNSVTVIITAEDPQPGTGIGELTVWAEGGAPVLAQPTANANEFTATLDVSGITQGSVSLNAQASDIVHNQSGIAQISVFKDTVGPEITIISPTQGTILGLSAMNAEFTIVDQALDSTSINCSLHQFVAEISGFGAPLENVVHAPVHLQGNTWSCTLDLFLIDASRVHRLVVSAADTAGNISEAHTPIIVDAVNPVFVNPTVQPQVISPINNSSKGIQDSAIVTVFVQEVNLTQWNLSVLNDNGQEVKQFNGSSPDVHITWYGNDQNDAMLSNGLYSFVFAAFDAAGNHAQLVMTPTVMIDNESPQMSLSLDDSYKPQNTLHLINVTATDNDVIALVEFWDEFSAPKTINPAADGSFQYEWPSTALAPGSYTLYARATDRAGNNSTASVIIEIKKSIAPEVSIIDPMNNSVLSGRSVPVTVTFSSDKGKVSSVSLIMDGTEIGILSPAPNQSQVAFSVDTTTYIDGNHTFTAKAVRGNPNNGDIAVSAPVSIVVHNGSPRIVFIEPVAFSPVPEGPVQIIAAISSPEEIFINADDISFAIEHMRKGVIQSSFEPAFQFANGILTSTISVDEGEYRIILTATDEAGNSSSKIQWFFAGLTISPDIEFFNPSNTESITLRYFVPEESRISIQAYKVEDDSLFSTIVNDQIQASGWQEAQWHGIGDDGAVAPDGGYYFRGNALSLSSGTSFQYSLPYTFPDNGEIVSNNSTAIQHNVEQKDFITWRVAQKALVSIFDNTCGAGSRIFHLSGEHTTEVDVRSCYGSLFETTPQVDYSLSVNNVPWNTVRAYGNTPVVESVSVYPHRLNPDISEISELRFTLKQDAFVSVSVVQNGVEVFAVLMDRVWVAADGTETVLTLNGWNDRGEALSDGPHEIRILTEDPSGNAAIYKAVLWVRRDPVIMIADNVITGKALFGEEVSILINGEIIESDLRTESGIYHKEIAHEPGTYLLRVETRDPERPATVYSTETQMRLYDWRNVDFNDVMAIYPEDGESLSFSFTLPEPAIISILMTPDSGGERKNILLFNKRNFDAGTHTITWDGRDGDGRILEQGYRIQVIDNSTMSSSIVKYLRVFVSMYHFVNNPKLQNINGEWFMQFDSGAMAIGEIQWGPSATYDQSSQENMFYRKHKLPLGQLESGTYHFRISTIALFGIRGRAEGSFSIPDGSVNLTFHTVNGPLSSVSRNQSAAVSSLPLLDENAETGSEDNDESPVYMAANTEWQEYGGELGIQSQSHSEQQIAQDTTAVTSGVQTRFLAAANVTNPFGTSQQAANCSRSASKITRKGCYTKIHTFVKGLNHWGDGFWTYGNANFGFGINGSTYLHPQLTYSYFDWQVDPMCGCGLPLCMYTYRNSGADRFMSENHGGPCNWLFKHWGYIDSGVILVDDGINTQGRPYFDIDTVEGKPNTYTPGNHDPHDGVTIDDIRNDEYCALPDNYSARTKAIIHVNQWDFQHDRCSGSEMSNSRIKGAHYFKNFFSRVHAPAEACWQQPLEVEIDVKSVWGLGGYSVIMSGAANAPVSVSDIRKFTIPSLGLSSYYITLWDKAGNEHRHRMETSAVAPRIGKDLYGSNESNPIVARPKGTRVMLYAFAHGYADGMIRCPSQVYLTDPALGSITLQEVTRTLSSGVEECRYEVMYKPGIQPATGEICVKEPNLECETCREIRVECAANYEWDASKNKCVRK